MSYSSDLIDEQWALLGCGAGRRAHRGRRRDRALGEYARRADLHHENRTTELMLEHLTEQCVADRLEPVLVGRGVTASAAATLGRQQVVGENTTNSATGWLEVACIAILGHLSRKRASRCALPAAA